MSEYSTFAHITKGHEGLCSIGSDGIDAADSYTSVEQLTAVWWQIYIQISTNLVSNWIIWSWEYIRYQKVSGFMSEALAGEMCAGSLITR